jgi:NTE family protein
VNAMSNKPNDINMKDMLDRSFHLAIAQGVYYKSSQCDLFIDPPNMSKYGMFDMEKTDEIFEYAYQYTLTQNKEIEEFLNTL